MNQAYPDPKETKAQQNIEISAIQLGGSAYLSQGDRKWPASGLRSRDFFPQGAAEFARGRRVARLALARISVPWDSLNVETGRLWRPIEGHNKMIEKADLTKYPGRRNAVSKYNRGFVALCSDSKSDGV
jgi:hypothetical protein